MKQVVLLVLMAALAGCGGSHKAKREGYRPAPIASRPVPPTTAGVAIVPAAPVAVRPFANGPLAKACMGSDRKARSRALCGCIQAVANTTLSGAQQSMAVSFYNDPHKAQTVRQSDSSAHERFWQDYTAYSEAAQRTCG